MRFRLPNPSGALTLSQSAMVDLGPLRALTGAAAHPRKLTTQSLASTEWGLGPSGDLRLKRSIGLGCLALITASTAATVFAGERAPEQFRLLALDGRSAVRWAVPPQGLPAKITYAFVTGSVMFPGARNCDGMVAPDAMLQRSSIGMDAFRREVRAAFDLWQQAANVQFEEISSATAAGILIGADAKPRGRAFTNVKLKAGVATRDVGRVGAIDQSLICLNPLQPWKIGFDGDLDVYDLRFTMTHEIGHAIGLDHPGPDGQLMSFRYVERSRDLQPGDIAGATALYGRRGQAPSIENADASRRDEGVVAAPRASSSLGLSEARSR